MLYPFLQKTFELPNSQSGTCNQKSFIAKGSNSRRTACDKGTCEAVVGQSSAHGQAGDARSCRCNGGLRARGLARHGAPSRFARGKATPPTARARVHVS